MVFPVLATSSTIRITLSFRESFGALSVIGCSSGLCLSSVRAWSLIDILLMDLYSL
jgi:hypothetical protein